MFSSDQDRLGIICHVLMKSTPLESHHMFGIALLQLYLRFVLFSAGMALVTKTIGLSNIFFLDNFE